VTVGLSSSPPPSIATLCGIEDSFANSIVIVPADASSALVEAEGSPGIGGKLERGLLLWLRLFAVTSTAACEEREQ